MSLPTKKILNLGVQVANIYPYNLGNGPYDLTTAEVMQGLQTVDIGMTSTNAEAYGGESAWMIDEQQVKCDVDLKFSSLKISMYGLGVLLGGDFTLGPADNQGQEQQYLSFDVGNRSPYFRLVATSKIGAGILIWTFPKLKIQGNIAFNMKADAYIIPEFNARACFDDTFARLDGVVGAPFDVYFGYNGQLSPLHS